MFPVDIPSTVPNQAGNQYIPLINPLNYKDSPAFVMLFVNFYGTELQAEWL